MNHGTNNCPSVTGTHLLLSESENLDLLEYASRISSLLERCAETNEPFLATLDDFLGAIYALMLAKGNNPAFVDRAGRIEKRAIVKRAGEAALGRIRLSGPLAGRLPFQQRLVPDCGSASPELTVHSSRRSSEMATRKRGQDS